MKRAALITYVLLILFTAIDAQIPQEPGIIVLGIAQDGGFPHMGCNRDCCNYAWNNPSAARFVTSLALVDPEAGKWYLVEATPDIKQQLRLFQEITGGFYNYLPDAIFITHAHIGHYAGLIQFGREVMNTSGLTVYTLPGMKKFLENNGPWSQLVSLNNISVVEFPAGGEVTVGSNITLNSFTVPHRDEYSETAGFVISTPGKRYLFIPDIDKWEKFTESILAKVKAVDLAFIDGTFMSIGELPGRDMSAIPHPFILETIGLFRDEPEHERNKIHFIHLNHTNPLILNPDSEQLRISGMHIAIQGEYY